MKTKTLLSILAFLFTVAASAQVYVNTATGVDASGAGTPVTPYKTIRYACTHSADYSTILIAPGTYPEVGEIFINKPLTVKSDGTAPVIIDASARVAAPTQEYMLAVVNTHDVTIDGLTFQNYIGPGYKGIWILSNSANAAVSNNITVKNCTVTNVGWTNNITTPPGANDNALPLKVDGGGSYAIQNVKLLNNRIYSCATGYSEGVVLTGNVDTFMVAGNTVHDISNIGVVIAGNYASTGAPASVNKARNGTVTRNEVYNCMSPARLSGGLYLDGAQNVVVSYNKLYRNAVGLSIGAEQVITGIAGGHKVFNNILYDNSAGGLYIGSSAGVSANPLQNTSFYNNTLYKNCSGQPINGVGIVDGTPIATLAGDKGEVVLLNQTGVTLQNNILYASPGKKCLVGLSTYTVSNFASNYNLYYREDGAPLINIVSAGFNGSASLAGNPFYTVGVFTAATSGLEANARTGNPAFAGAASANFQLTNTSAALNMGSLYSPSLSGDTDYAGAQRVYGPSIDAGAYELQELAGVNAVARPSLCSISPNPAQGVCYVRTEAGYNHFTATLTDMSGRKIAECYSGSMPSGQPIPISLAGLGDGTYILYVTADGKHNAAKISVR